LVAVCNTDALDAAAIGTIRGITAAGAWNGWVAGGLTGEANTARVAGFACRGVAIVVAHTFGAEALHRVPERSLCIVLALPRVFAHAVVDHTLARCGIADLAGHAAFRGAGFDAAECHWIADLSFRTRDLIA